MPQPPPGASAVTRDARAVSPAAPAGSTSPDGRAFEILVREHHRRVLAYALALTGRETEAEDLAQEAFVTAWRNMDKFDAARDFGRWLRGIVRRKHLELARARREQTLSEKAIDALEAAHTGWDAAVREGRGGRAEALAALRECLALLDELLRRAVELFYLERLPCAEIAVRTETSDAAVRKRLQRAREGLAGCVRRKLAE